MYLVTFRWLSVFLLSLSLVSLQAQSTQVVSNNGLAFTPVEITITVGDTVDWQIGGSHNVVQVSQATYDANEATALDGGFEVSFGGGKLAFDSVGTFYYVCSPHAGQGMKGIVNVQEATTRLAETVPTLDLSIATLAEGKFQVSFQREPSAQVSFRILDLSGRVVQQPTPAMLGLKTTQALDLTALPRGTYLIELRQEGFAPATVRVIR